MSHVLGEVKMTDNNTEKPPFDNSSGSETIQNSRRVSQEENGPVIDTTFQTPSKRTITGVSWIVVVASVLSSTFLFAIDNTITADIQPAIVHQFNDTGKLSWISVSFLLTSAAMNLPW